MPAEAVRTAITLVVFVHLFIAAVAALGSLRANSAIVVRLNEKLATQLAYPDWLILSRFAYELTYHLDRDYDGNAEIVLNWDAADEARPERVAAKDKLLLFDADEIKLPIRRQRYLSLIRRMSDVASDPSMDTREIELPAAVSKVLLAEAGNPNGQHRFRLIRIVTPAPSYADETETPPLPPAFQGNILVRDGKYRDMTKADQASLVSPPVQGRTNPKRTAPLGNGIDSGPRRPPNELVPGDGLIPRGASPTANPERQDGNR